ncbi:MAG: hypothetical protein K2Y32_02610 [Candidatus Obscuribacterales bacterium]|nr:hypothetical protein [Candidatus Obscuribacterales bacterium]OPZ90560.1 MAG: hypothetical protein BWY75_00684 [bacterium ADurb.Bin425]
MQLETPSELLPGQMCPWQLLPGFKGVVYLIERIFGIENHSLYEEF